MNTGYIDRIAKKMDECYSHLLTEQDCADLAEDIAVAMELPKFKQPIMEWLNGKLQYTDVVVNGFSLVELAEALDEEYPNIPIAVLLLYLEENQPDDYRAISAIADEICVADLRLIQDGIPCEYAVRAEGKWYFLGEEQDADYLEEYQMWQILLLNPVLTLQVVYEHPDGTALILQDDGSYLITQREE